MDYSKQTYYTDMLKICLAVERKTDLLNITKSENLASNKELLDSCLDCVSDVFCKYGLNENDEPNACGFILEDLIDYLNNLIYKFENIS